ncbi:MAG: bifunctional metallophosphatase/5'-nucleotidase [Pseudomonadota bacterium]
MTRSNLRAAMNVALGVAAATFLTTPAFAENDKSDDTFTLQVLHTADADSNGRVALDNVGRFSGLVKQFTREYRRETLLLSSGDNYIPGPRFNAAGEDEFVNALGEPSEGRLDIALLNAMKFQASAVGNHELDAGTSAEIGSGGFASIFGRTDAWVGARFPYLAANLDFTTDEALAPFVTADGKFVNRGRGRLAGTAIIKRRGHKIGVIGATTPTLPVITNEGGITVNPAIDGADFDVAELAAVLQPAVDSLREKGVDKIIMLAHMQQIEIERQLANLLDGVDIIIAGGSNTRLVDETDRLQPGDEAQGTYPNVLESASGEPVLLVNTDGDYKYLGRLVVDFDSEGKILLESLDTEVNGAYATDIDSYNFFGAPAQNQSVVNLVQIAQDTLARIDAPIGLTNVFLEGARDPGVRTEETNLGNLTADANLAAAQAFDPSVVVSLKNGGGIRASIGSRIVPPGGTEAVPTPPAGGIIGTLALQTTLRFNNDLSLLTLTGQNLREVLEHGIGAIPGVSGRFPQVGGVEFSYDATLPEGSRIVSATITGGGVATPLVIDGVTQSPDATYRIVTLNFLAGGGDGYPFPQDASANRIDLPTVLTDPGAVDFAVPGSEQDALAEFLIANFPVGGDVAFDQADTPAGEDTRIVRLDTL